MQTKLIIGTIFSIFVAVFSIQNAVPVSVSFFSWKFETSLVVVVLGALAAGVIIMGVFSSFKQLRQRKKIRDLNKEKDKLKENINELKEKVDTHQDELSKIKNKYKKENNENQSNKGVNIEEDNIKNKNNNQEEE